MMTVVCAWCKKVIEIKEGPDVITHGVCKKCKEAQLKLIEQTKK